jgi:hypothetical protein
MTDPSQAAALVTAIRSGDIEAIQQLLRDRPGLASSPLGGPQGTRTAVHVVADWPGLHWAASSDDVDVASALIDGGADIEAPDGSIGTPLDNAIGYACSHVARRLVAGGAKVDKLWHAAARMQDSGVRVAQGVRVREGRRRTGRAGRSTSGAGGRSARCHRSGSTSR